MTRVRPGWDTGNAVAGILIAMAPVPGAMADLGGSRKRFMLTFAYFGALMTAALFWIGRNQWHLALLAYGLAVVGFAGANIFYDARFRLFPTGIRGFCVRARIFHGVSGRRAFCLRSMC